MIQTRSIRTEIRLRMDKKYEQTDGMEGRMQGRRQKYISLTSSVDDKESKSNGNIDLKKPLIQQFIKITTIE